MKTKLSFVLFASIVALLCAAQAPAQQEDDAPTICQSRPITQEKFGCLPGSTLISGNFCPKPEEKCLNWIDPPNSVARRCARYEEPARCLTKTVPMKYCITTEELYDHNTQKPYNNQTYGDCKAKCSAEGMRLCSHSEWQFSCEGEANNPYPYGFTRDVNACNIEHHPFKKCGKLNCDYSANISEFPKCVSSFGVHNLVGDVDEWLTVPEYYAGASGMHLTSALAGGHTGGGRHRCSPLTYGHGGGYSDTTTGCRCCGDALHPVW